MKRTLPLIILYLLSLGGVDAQYAITFVKDTEPTQCTGIIMVSVSEAETGPYTIEAILNGPNGETLVATKSAVSSIATFADLCEGSYTIRITDDFGCEQDLSAFVDGCDDIELTFPPATYITNSTNCNAPNGEVTIHQNVFTGGHGNITWEWSAGTIGLHGLVDLSPGTYTLTATDEVGCEGIFNFEVGGEELWLDGFAQPTCEGQTIGAVYAGASYTTGGPSNYEWSNGATTEKIINLAAGSYTVTATHIGSGCQAVETFVVEEIPNASSFTIDGVMTNTCPNENNGSIVLSISGASGPVSYQWDCSNCFGAYVQELPAGTHTVVATDYCGNVANASFEIQEFDEPILSIEIWDDCSGDGTGGIGIGQLGAGTLNSDFYAFYLNSEPLNVPFGYTKKDLPVGNYVLEAISSNGCSETYDIRINSESVGTGALKIDLTKPEDINCYGIPYLSPKVSGGAPKYSYVWREHHTNQIVSFDSQLDQSFVPGLYNLTVRDKCGEVEYYPIYDFRCQCDHQFGLTANGLTPCVWPYDLQINSLLPYTHLTYGHYNFEWSYDGNGGVNTDASFVKHLDGSNEWDNQQKTYWNNGSKSVKVEDPRGCNYDKFYYLSGQPANIANMSAFATGIYTDLYEERPNLFPEDFDSEFLVQTGCGVFETCGDNYNGQQSTVLLTYTPYAGDHPNPCQRGGTLRCGSYENSEGIVNVPENSIASYFVDTDGNCACLFPTSLFPDQNYLYPLYLEFPCDQLGQDPSSQGGTISLFDPDLCVCDMCFWNNTEEPNCGYTVTCASTMEVIATVELLTQDWSICKGVSEQIGAPNLDNWWTRIFCPFDECFYIPHLTGYFSDTDPESIFPDWEDLPDCKICEGRALVDTDAYELGPEIHSLNDSSISDTLTVSTNGPKEFEDDSLQSSIFPNPVRSGQRTLRITNVDMAHLAAVELISASGKVIESPKLLKLDNSIGRLELNQKLPSGVYFVRLKLKTGENLVHRIIVI